MAECSKVEMEISQTPWMNYSGLALACVSLIFMYLAARYDCVKTTKEVEPVEADVEAPAEGDKESRRNPNDTDGS